MHGFTFSKFLIFFTIIFVFSACGGGSASGDRPFVPEDGSSASGDRPPAPGDSPPAPGDNPPGDDPSVQPPVKSSLSGSLLVSGIGQPGETVVSEFEPNDNTVTANFLGPLTNNIDYQIKGGLTIDDPQDVFYFTEAIAQVVTVTLAYDASIDFDVQIWDIKPDGTFEVIGKSSVVTSPDVVIYNTPAGDFTTAVVVTPYEGTGRYELTITAEPLTEAATTSVAALARSAVDERVATYIAGNDHTSKPRELVWDVSDFDAVPGEILVKPRGNISSVRSFSAKATNNLHNMRRCGEVTEAAILLCDNAVPSGIRSLSNADSKQAEDEALRRTMGKILLLRTDHDVEEVAPNYILHSSAVTPNDKLFPLQWHYSMIGLPDAWEMTTGNEAVIVAVLDTGIISSHPDFIGQLVDGYDFISDANRAGDGDGIDPDPTEPGVANPNKPNTWHGTHVAGTIGAASNNSIGVAGVSWKSKMMPVRVMDEDGAGTLVDILNGVKYAAGLPNASGSLPNKRADIINLSLGGGTAVPLVQDVFNQVRAQGVLVVAAAGNENTDILSYPASYEGVLSVSAVNLEQKKANYSNYGSMIDIAAPGGDLGTDDNGDGYPDGILSTVVGTAGEYLYGFYAGTSMAAPHVAGVAALVLSANPNLSVDELENILLSSAKDVGLPGRDDFYGHGLLDAATAVQMAASNVLPPASFAISPSTINFGVDNQRLEVTLVSASLVDQNVSIAEIQTTDGNSWLSASLTPNNITPLVIEIDRSDLDARRYAGRVIINTILGRYEVEVAMDVASNIVVPEVGAVTLRLINSTDGRTVMEAQTDETKNYRYDFTDIQAGSYYLRAGTDKDNDGSICETDDFCGAYLTLTDPSVFDVADGSSINGLDFPLFYQGTGVPDLNPLPDDPAVEILKPLIGTWDFSYTIINNFTQRYFLKSIEVVNNDLVIVGTDISGDSLIADSLDEPVIGYNFSLLEPGKTILGRFYLFNMTAGAITGLYWQVDPETGDLIDINRSYDMTGSRVDEALLAENSAFAVDDTEEKEMLMVDLLTTNIATPKSSLIQVEEIEITAALRHISNKSNKLRNIEKRK